MYVFWKFYETRNALMFVLSLLLMFSLFPSLIAASVAYFIQNPNLFPIKMNWNPILLHLQPLSRLTLSIVLTTSIIIICTCFCPLLAQTKWARLLFFLLGSKKTLLLYSFYRSRGQTFFFWKIYIFLCTRSSTRFWDMDFVIL